MKNCSVLTHYIFIGAICYLALLISSCLVAAEKTENVRHVAVVCPEPLRPGLDSWISWRQTQGYVFHFITAGLAEKSQDPNNFVSPQSIREKIRDLAQRVHLEFLVLVGNGLPQNLEEGWRNIVPAARVPALVIQRFGNEDHIASDTWYADLDDDGLPNMAVGRLPVSSPEELWLLLERTKQYEMTLPDGQWQRKVNVIAGVGGFTRIVDMTIELIVRKIFTELLPADYDLSLTNANWKSPFCPYPPAFHDVTISRLNEGCLLWVYLGHGLNQQLDYVVTPDTNYNIFDLSDIPLVRCDKGPPLVFFFACYTGAFDTREKSLACQLLLADKGPVGVLAASRTSMPYAMSIMGVEMLDSMNISVPSLTVGEILTSAKYKMIHRPESLPSDSEKKPSARDKIFASLDETARMFDPSGHELPLQLMDHIQMMNWLGDPLLRIRRAQSLSLSTPDIAYASHEIDISGTLDHSEAGQHGSLLVELSLERNRSVVSSPKRSSVEISSESEKLFQNVYYTANNPVIAKKEINVQDGKFSTRFQLPDDVFGSYIIKVSGFIGNRFYSAGDRIRIRSYDSDSRRPSAEKEKK